ncbi:peptidoglycan-binding domain-containing protein [Leisingera sp. ANG-M7]|uniref:peptidoglycan-binding domain-containing protein n=1 Tax=Leisingera sp. ANG-M7 TaxID=1577902 RepID=UPI001269DFDC|nr:peptidoglycan-binding domain-containing protein [Leisingera sp. ANG-M7]
MAAKLSASVGRKGKNLPEDVKTVQQLLNAFAGQSGIKKVKADGTPSPVLEKMIGQFQQEICGFKPDCRIDPGKTTIKKLNAGPGKAKAEKKAKEKQDEKAKEDAKAKAVKAAKDALVKEAKAKSLDQGGWAALLEEIEDYATSLYDSYFAKGEKKGEDPQKAAKQAAEKAAKEAQKKAAENVIKTVDTGGLCKPGRLTGKTQGVKKKILDVLYEVSSHYGETIHVVSGLRDKKGQASAMYGGWNSHLKRGKIYSYLKSNEELRLELDGFVQAGDKKGFIACMFKKANWKYISRHLSGQAVDVTTRTDPKIISALSTCLRYLAERNSEGIKCHHFDNRKLIYPVPDNIKKKWKM